jgi:hypothetical protein
MLVDGVVVEDGMDELASRDSGLDPVQETDEFLMAVARHALADDRAVENIERETPARRMISAVPQPSAVARMIRARHTCFCRLLRSATTAANRSRSAALTSILIPSRIAHYRTHHTNMESYDCVVPH